MLLEWLKTVKIKSVLVMLGIKVFKKKREVERTKPYKPHLTLSDQKDWVRTVVSALVSVLLL